MTKLNHQKAVKSLIKKILTQRRRLIRMNVNRRPDNVEMAKIMAEMDYQLGDIQSFDRMMNWISQCGVRTRIFKVIPSNCKSWKEEYDRLVYTGLVLQGKIIKEKQTELF